MRDDVLSNRTEGAMGKRGTKEVVYVSSGWYKTNFLLGALGKRRSINMFVNC